MAEAFWSLLERGPYKSITIRALCAEAHVNANTIYRYFDGIDAMAADLFRETLVDEFPLMLLRASRDPGFRERLVAGAAGDPALMKRFSRIVLFARSGSDYLRGLLADALLDAWMRDLGLDFAELPRPQQFDVRYIIGGELAAISSEDPVFTFEDLAAMGERALGRGIMKTLGSLSA